MDKKARILVVDDQPELLRVMQRMLRVDFDVVTTDRAYEAIKLIRTENFAVVIVDLVMPEMSGLDILQRVKRISPTTEVIIVTGYASVRTTKKALRAGAYDYLERPFSRTELQHVVRNALLCCGLSEETGAQPPPRTEPPPQLLERIGQLEKRLAREETRTFQNTVELLYQLFGACRQDTMMHLRSVEEYALPVGRKLGLNSQEQNALQVAAAFHDIGKISVDEAILGKQGPLNDVEWQHMRQHPVTGAEIVGTVQEWQDAVDGVLYHQEHLDGTGYPSGLAGDQIPKLARIVAVADAYDAMTSDRAYKSAMSRQDAINELERCKGTQFDPNVVDAFISII